MCMAQSLCFCFSMRCYYGAPIFVFTKFLNIFARLNENRCKWTFVSGYPLQNHFFDAQVLCYFFASWHTTCPERGGWHACFEKQ